MSIASAESLIDWTQTLHSQLATALGDAQAAQQDFRARELLGYLQQHEFRLAKLVEGFEKRADFKALNTRIQDYEAHSNVDIAKLCAKPFDTMSYDDIAEAVFDVHNNIIELYEFMRGRAPIPEEIELLEDLLDMQRHETQQIAHQVNRGRDL